MKRLMDSIKASIAVMIILGLFGTAFLGLLSLGDHLFGIAGVIGAGALVLFVAMTAALYFTPEPDPSQDEKCDNCSCKQD